MKRAARGGVRLIIILAVVLALAAGGVLVVRAVSRPVVQVTRTVEADVVQAFYATGPIVPEREYPIRSQVAGVLMLVEGVDKVSSVMRGQLVGRVISDCLGKKLKHT